MSKTSRVFFNVSNHPSSKWGDEQKEHALVLAEEIQDFLEAIAVDIEGEEK